MNDDSNLTPEGLQREEAQAKTGPSLYERINQAKNSYDDYQNIKNTIQARKFKNISDIGSSYAKTSTSATSIGTAATGTGATAAGTGAAAAGTGAAATAGTGTAAAAGTGTAAAAGTGAAAAAGTGAAAAAGVGILPILGIILLIILSIALIGVTIASIYYSIIDPISIKYSVDPEAVVNDYDINDVPSDVKDENGNLLSDSDVGGIRNILNTDDLDLDNLFGGISSSRLTGIEYIRSKIYELFNWLPGSHYSEALVNKIIEINLNDKLQEMGTEDKEKLPLGALLTTFTYTYSSQYLDSDRNIYSVNLKDSNDQNDGETVNRVNPSTPISMIVSLFNEDILALSDINDLLDNMVYHEFYPTYSWEEVDKECDYDEEGNETFCTIFVGCLKSDNESYKLDYYKYYLYLRYGSYVSGYATDGYSNNGLYNLENTEKLWGKSGIKNYKEDSNDTIAFGYEYFKNLNAAYISSSNECKLKQVANASFEKLNASADENVKYEMIEGNAEHSVDRANNFFNVRDVTNGVDTININHEIFSDFSKYDSKATPYSDDTTEPVIKVDNTKPNGNGNFAVNYNIGENYEYEHGWIYNRFPFFRDEFQKEEETIYLYDAVKTPKTIEIQIENIDSYKEVFNDVLGYDTSIYAFSDWSSSFNSDGTESFPLPVGEYTITSCVGERTIDGQFSNHGGIDIAVSRGTPLYAWKSGVVVRTNNSCGEGYYGDTCGGGYGNFVVIDHGEENGEKRYTIYAHMSNTSVLVGDEVSAGQQIGTSGNSGSSTGPHLHFEIRIGGTEWRNSIKQDPYPTLAEIVGGEDMPNQCAEGTIFNVQATLINGNKTNSENKKELCELLVNKFSQNGAIALMANAAHESSYNTGANGDSGSSYGLFQWHKGRKQNLLNAYPNSYNTVQSQFNFLLSELNSYSDLYNDLISGAKSSKELAYDFCYEFERPSKKEISCKNRMSSSKYKDAENYVKNGCQ